MQGTRPARVRLGAFEFDTRTGELHHDGQAVMLQEQQFQVLLMLVERQGEIVTREEIRKRLWPNDTVVEFDHGINNTIKNLRRLLGDSAESPKYIETIARRGYRLVVSVEWMGAELFAEEPSRDSSSAHLSFRAATERNPGKAEETAGGNLEAFPTAKLQVGHLSGRVVSHYRVLEVIGGGGMGLVYRAEDLKLGRAVALKFLPEEVGDDAKARERFEREAHAVSALDHPNICSIYEFDEYEGHPFIVMQLLQGKTLRDHLAEGRFRLTEPEGLEVAIQIACGLEAAHEKGIIHRDIKPANIFITEKNVTKILDFGVAKVLHIDAPESHSTKGRLSGAPEGGALKEHGLAEMAARQPRRTASLEEERGEQSRARLLPAQSSNEEASGAPEGAPLHTTLTRTGVKLGTAGYMSPEQVRGEPLDARTDIFSFGLVLYEMASGERAFTGQTEAVVHDAIVSKKPAPAREKNPQISPKLEAVVDRALEKKRDSRYQTMAEMRGDLEQANAKRTRPARVNWKWYVAAALISVSVVSAGLFFGRSRTRIKFTNKDNIVLAHFQNSTGDAVMEDALDWPLIREVTESPYLTALNSSKVRDTLKLLKIANLPETPAGPEMTPDVAREVCIRTDSRAFITAAIANVGNYYHVTLSAQECRSGKTLAVVEAETDDRNEIVKNLGTAGHQLRRKLGEPEESLRTFSTPLENETSWSVEALHAFNQAWRLRAEEGSAAAIAQFQRAVELDPNLAVAQLNLGASYLAVNQESLGKSYVTAAFNLRQRLSQRSRWFMEAEYYLVMGEFEKANAIFVQWLQTFPADPYTHLNFAVSLEGIGQYERAAVEAREGIRLTPGNPGYAYENLMEPLVYMNRLEEAKAVFEQARARGIDGLGQRSLRYRIAFLQHDTPSMQEQLSWALAKPETKEWAIGQQVGNAIYYGHIRGVRKLYSGTYNDSGHAGTTSPDQDALVYMMLADIETGSPVRAKHDASIALARIQTSRIRRVAALVLARVGAQSEAEGLLELIDQDYPLDTVVQRYELPTIRAATELDKNQPARAIEILQPVLAYDLVRPVGIFPGLYPNYLRGLAYLKIGDGKQAATEFQKIVDHPGIVQNSLIAPLSHLQLARAQVMVGDNGAARKSYQDFLTLWKDADPDIPIYRQAKAEYARLNKPPATSHQLRATRSQLSAISHQ